jgi:hypothetical protein
MNDVPDVKALQAEISSLRTEISDLREFVKALYNMVMADDDYEDEGGGDFLGGPEFGRFNT